MPEAVNYMEFAVPADPVGELTAAGFTDCAYHNPPDTVTQPFTTAKYACSGSSAAGRLWSGAPLCVRGHPTGLATSRCRTRSSVTVAQSQIRNICSYMCV